METPIFNKIINTFTYETLSECFSNTQNHDISCYINEEYKEKFNKNVEEVIRDIAYKYSKYRTEDINLWEPVLNIKEWCEEVYNYNEYIPAFDKIFYNTGIYNIDIDVYINTELKVDNNYKIIEMIINYIIRNIQIERDYGKKSVYNMLLSVYQKFIEDIYQDTFKKMDIGLGKLIWNVYNDVMDENYNCDYDTYINLINFYVKRNDKKIRKLSFYTLMDWKEIIYKDIDNKLNTDFMNNSYDKLILQGIEWG